MNQNPRGVGAPPRPQQTNPTGGQAPRRRPTPTPPPKTFDVSGAFWVVLGVTIFLLVAMLVTMTVLLIVDGSSAPAPTPSGGGQSQTDDDGKDEGNTLPPPTKSSKTKITLPSTTKAGVYSYSASTATDISGDSGIVSQAVALIDVTNGRAVASKNGSARVYPASMTKVMTVLLACEKATDPLTLLTVSEEMVTRYKSLYKSPKDAPSVGLTWEAGYQITVEDALYLAIYQSDTYACWLLAEHVAGSEEHFAKMMTQRAKELGCTGTNFINATGLEDSNHYTTCFDMATIMAAAMNNEVAYKILTSYNNYSFDIYVNGVKTKNQSWYSAWYKERLEKHGYEQTSWYYAGKGSDIRILGGKTGFEANAGYCFVTAGQITDNTGSLTGTLYVCVQAGATSVSESTYDTREIYQRYATY